jgi:hypothetical protein
MGRCSGCLRALCKVLIIKFPYLPSGIDPRHDSAVGFQAIAAKLFALGSPLPLAESQALADKMHTFWGPSPTCPA